MNKKSWITIIIILAVIILSILVLIRPHPETEKEITECIADNSILYVQLGCHACKAQEDLFGENYHYLNIVDCWFEKEECLKQEIQATPTWIINGEKIIGVQTLEQLKSLTGC